MKNFLSLWVVGGILSCTVCALAQGATDRKDVFADTKAVLWVWQDSIGELRKGAQALIEAYDKLTSENDLLFTELANIQKSIEEAKQENQRLIHEPARIGTLINEETAKEKPLAKSIKEIEVKIQAMTKDNQKLQEKLLRLSGKLKPWEDQMAALNAKRTELEIELKLQESDPSGFTTQPLIAEIEGLKAQMLASEQREQELKSALKEASEQFKPSAEMVKLNNERKSVLAAIEDLKKKNAAMEKTNATAEASQLKQKADLEGAVKETQAEIDRLKQTASGEDAAPAVDQGKSLYEKMQALEKENHDLESRIFDLSQAIDVIQKDSAMIEALLRAGKDNEMPEMSPFDNIAEAIAYAYAYHGMYEEAIAKYDQALKQGGDKRNIYFNLGYIYAQMGNVDEAMKCYKSVLKIDPHDYEAKRNIAKLREDKQR